LTRVDFNSRSHAGSVTDLQLYGAFMVAMALVQVEMAVHTAKPVKLLDVLLMPDTHAHTDCTGQREKRNASCL